MASYTGCIFKVCSSFFPSCTHMIVQTLLLLIQLYFLFLSNLSFSPTLRGIPKRQSFCGDVKLLHKHKDLPCLLSDITPLLPIPLALNNVTVPRAFVHSVCWFQHSSPDFWKRSDPPPTPTAVSLLVLLWGPEVAAGSGWAPGATVVTLMASPSSSESEVSLSWDGPAPLWKKGTWMRKSTLSYYSELK